MHAFETDACCESAGNEAPSSVCVDSGTAGERERALVGDHCNAIDVVVDGNGNGDAEFPGLN